MLHFLPADVFSVVKDVFAVLGGVLGGASAVFGIWYAIKRRAESKRQQERKDDIELSDKFARLEVQVDHLQTTASTIERQYIEFRDSALAEQKELAKQIDDLRARSDQYHKAADVASIRRDVQRIQDQLRRLDDEFRKHRDMVLEKYLTLSSYQNDLIMWTKTFDDLRQSLRDVHLTLNKRSR